MKLRSRLDNIVSRKWDFFKSRFIVFEKNILYYLGIAVPRLYLLISHASSLSWPPKDDNFFSHVGLRGGSQSCSKQVYGNQFITKRLRDIGQKPTSMYHDSQVGSLVAYDIPQHCPWFQHLPEIGQVTGHTAKVELRHPGIKSFKTRCFTQGDTSIFDSGRNVLNFPIVRYPQIIVVTLVYVSRIGSEQQLLE